MTISLSPGPGETPLLVRGLRYLDRLRRTADGWKIERRIHIPTWQFDATSVPVDLGMH